MRAYKSIHLLAELPYKSNFLPEGSILYLTLQFSSSDLVGGSFISIFSSALTKKPSKMLKLQKKTTCEMKSVSTLLTKNS